MGLFDVRVNSKQWSQLLTKLGDIAMAITNLNAPQPLEVVMTFVVKDDNPDVAYSLALGEVTDAEGNPIPTPALSVSVTSDNSDVVTVTPDADPATGTVHFGNPGNATITANVSSGGNLLGSGVAGFVVTVGDPAAITSVALSFDGLTES